MAEPNLERRMSQRIPKCIAMQIYAYGMLIASGETVEMSEHGLLMRVEHDYSDDALDPGKHLDIMLETDPDPSAECWLPIKVIRKWEHGIAAQFIGVDAAVYPN